MQPPLKFFLQGWCSYCNRPWKMIFRGGCLTTTVPKNAIFRSRYPNGTAPRNVFPGMVKSRCWKHLIFTISGTVLFFYNHPWKPILTAPKKLFFVLVESNFIYACGLQISVTISIRGRLNPFIWRVWNLLNKLDYLPWNLIFHNFSKFTYKSI